MNNTALLAKVNEMVEVKMTKEDLDHMVSRHYFGTLDDAGKAEWVAYHWNANRAFYAR